MSSRRGFFQYLFGAAAAIMAPAAARTSTLADEGPRPGECRLFIGSLETPILWSAGDGRWWRWDREGRVVKANVPPRDTT